MSFEQATEFELAVGPHDGVGIDFEIDGELANGGKLVACRQRAGGDAAADLVDQLAVNGDAAVQVDGEPWRRGSVVPSHAYQCTTLLVHYVKCFLKEKRDGPVSKSVRNLLAARLKPRPFNTLDLSSPQLLRPFRVRAFMSDRRTFLMRSSLALAGITAGIFTPLEAMMNVKPKQMFPQVGSALPQASSGAQVAGFGWEISDIN